MLCSPADQWNEKCLSPLASSLAFYLDEADAHNRWHHVTAFLWDTDYCRRNSHPSWRPSSGYHIAYVRTLLSAWHHNDPAYVIPPYLLLVVPTLLSGIIYCPSIFLCLVMTTRDANLVLDRVVNPIIVRYLNPSQPLDLVWIGQLLCISTALVHTPQGFTFNVLAEIVMQLIWWTWSLQEVVHLPWLHDIYYIDGQIRISKI
ncbi:hypothetical protein BDR07DRAFT_213798 [Suillus spraguei]|nr:hypothetical protein BDR07DRAFT_213798 [Suillus spraguei]